VANILYMNSTILVVCIASILAVVLLYFDLRSFKNEFSEFKDNVLHHCNQLTLMVKNNQPVHYSTKIIPEIPVTPVIQEIPMQPEKKKEVPVSSNTGIKNVPKKKKKIKNEQEFDQANEHKPIYIEKHDAEQKYIESIIDDNEASENIPEKDSIPKINDFDSIVSLKSITIKKEADGEKAIFIDTDKPEKESDNESVTSSDAPVSSKTSEETIRKTPKKKKLTEILKNPTKKRGRGRPKKK